MVGIQDISNHVRLLFSLYKSRCMRPALCGGTTANRSARFICVASEHVLQRLWTWKNHPCVQGAVQGVQGAALVQGCYHAAFAGADRSKAFWPYRLLPIVPCTTPNSYTFRLPGFIVPVSVPSDKHRICGEILDVHLLSWFCCHLSLAALCSILIIVENKIIWPDTQDRPESIGNEL